MSDKDIKFEEFQNEIFKNFEEAEEDCQKVCRQLGAKVDEYIDTSSKSPMSGALKEECEALCEKLNGSMRLLTAKWILREVIKERISLNVFWFLNPTKLPDYSEF